MDNKLFLLALTCLLTLPIAAMEEGGVVARSSDQTIVKLKDDKVMLSREELKILQERSETIKDLFADIPATTEINLENFTQKQFEDLLRLMKLNGDKIKIELNKKSKDELINLLSIIEFLNTPIVLTQVKLVLDNIFFKETLTEEEFKKLPQQYGRTEPSLDSLSEEFKEYLIRDIYTVKEKKGIFSLAFNTTDKLLAVAFGTNIDIFDASHATSIQKLETLTSSNKSIVTSLAFDENQRLLASGLVNKTVDVYDISSLKLPERGLPATVTSTTINLIKSLIMDKSGLISSVVFDAQNKILATGSWNKDIIIYDTSEEKFSTIATLTGDESVYELSFNPKRTLLVVSYKNGTVGMYKYINNKLERISLITNHAKKLGEREAVFSRPLALDNEHDVLAIALDENVYLYNISFPGNPKEVGTIKNSLKVLSLAFDDKNNYLAIGLSDGTIKIYTALQVRPYTKIRHLITLKLNKSAVSSLSFNSDQNFLAAGSKSGEVKVYDFTLLNTFKHLSTVQLIATLYLIKHKLDKDSAPEEVKRSLETIDQSMWEIISNYIRQLI